MWQKVHSLAAGRDMRMVGSTCLQRAQPLHKRIRAGLAVNAGWQRHVHPVAGTRTRHPCTAQTYQKYAKFGNGVNLFL